MADDLPAIPSELLAPPGTEGLIDAIENALDPSDLPGWTIEDPGQNAWAMSIYAEAVRARDANATLAATWRSNIGEWLANANRLPQRTIDFFEVRLRDYALRLREASVDAHGKAHQKTVHAPTGKVSTRDGVPHIIVVGESEAVAWCIENMPEAVKSMLLISVISRNSEYSRADGAVLGRVVAHGTGEVIPGLAVEYPGPSATVTPS